MFLKNSPFSIQTLQHHIVIVNMLAIVCEEVLASKLAFCEIIGQIYDEV